MIRMLDDVNNWAIPIDHTLDRYFNKDNYFTWMAFNILVSNIDTNAQNFYLYSPQNSETWYFLPWDYDGAFVRARAATEQDFRISDIDQGFSYYWGAVLHRRVLMVPEYRQRLDDKVTALMAWLTPARITDILTTDRRVTDQFVTQMPDVYYLPGTYQLYDREYGLIPGEIQINYQLYRDGLTKPMPFYLGVPQDLGTELKFNWDEAYDFEGQDITYHLVISTGWDFQDIVRDVTVLNTTEVRVSYLTPSTYFWKVTATNETGNHQGPFDSYIDSDGQPHFGMKYLYIAPDGRILEKGTE